ncbi:phage tail tape measure protein [Priestia megaterium]|nr:phage tail tape measure protein [Priestia megaterium]TPF17925.1 phage tail tape measure protein [Priestia megaterium]TPF22033.1 phage tail tape measure protein [Priestia megaterium]
MIPFEINDLKAIFKATQSVDTLTAAMLNFGIEAKDSLQIADQLNEVDNNFAISTKDLADGIRKAGSTAKTFGVDITQLEGHIAAIGSTTRESGNQVGNGLKTIYSRITTMKPAADALASVNIEINDMTGNVKPVNTILGELAEKWSTLSDSQRQNMGVTLAGRNQLSR